LRIGFLQFAPALGDVQATIQKIGSLLSQSAQVDLWVLPELCNSGYNFESMEQARATSEAIGDSVFLQYLESLCQQNGFHMVTGFNEREGDVLYNSALLIGPEGLVGRYRKLHLFMNEKDFFEPGDMGLPVFDIGQAKIGMLVCFDWLFPEVWRILALKGADLICHPSNLVLPGLAQKAIPIHALTHRVFVVTANRIGTEADLTFTGLSTIAGPRGDVLLQALPEEERAGHVDIDLSLARDKSITRRNDVFGDRRPEEYAFLLGRDKL
jgi:predicted amidohydrolase